MTDAQQELDDEILSACHDGELPPTEADAVRRRLVREPELAKRLFAIQCVDAAVVSAFRSVDREPVPAGILARLRADEDESRERRLEARNVVALRKPLAGRAWQHFGWLVAVASRAATAAKRAFRR